MLVTSIFLLLPWHFYLLRKQFPVPQHLLEIDLYRICALQILWIWISLKLRHVVQNQTELKISYFRHGTECAGVAVAVKNNKCVIGAAYNAEFQGRHCRHHMGFEQNASTISSNKKTVILRIFINLFAGPNIRTLRNTVISYIFINLLPYSPKTW